MAMVPGMISTSVLSERNFKIESRSEKVSTPEEIHSKSSFLRRRRRKKRTEYFLYS